MKGFSAIFMMLIIAFSSFGLNTPNFIQEQDESQSISDAISDTMDYVDESINFTVENATVVLPYDTGFPMMANCTDKIKPALKLIPTSGKNANNGHLNKKYDPGSCY